MRHITLWIGLLCFAALSGCGNANDGKPFSPLKKATSSSITGTPNPTANAVPLTKLLFCKNPLMTLGDLGQLLLGSNVCPTEGAASNVRGSQVYFKVNANVPVNARLCMIPFVGDSPAQETCFAINGSAYIQLSTDQYNSVVVVSENNLGAYKSFIVDPNASAPPRAVYSL